MLTYSYLCKEIPKLRNMKKLIVLLIVVIVGATMVMTCPDKEAHLTAINNEFSTFIDNEIAEKTNIDGKKDDALGQGLSMIASVFAGGLVKTVTEQKLIVRNYFVCSVGQFNTDEGPKTVSVGVLGHVFTLLSSETMKESIKDI